MQQQPRKISVLGAGACGSAVALALATRHDVVLWGRNRAVMQEMAEARDNRAYLPGFPFPDGLTVHTEFDAAVAHVAGPDGLLIAACPVAGLRPLLEQLKGRDLPNIVWLCKGFEYDTGLLPHQIVQQVARGLPCALTIASTSAALREHVVATVHGGNIRVYSCEDLVGVEVGGAVKNVLAIATGVADGLGLGLNARAALITRGLAEITRLGTTLGGNIETFIGLTGMGDLILTCTGDLSRNRRVGLGLAQGKPLDVIVGELGHVAEGVPCAKAVRELARKLGVDMPITNAVAAVLFDGDQVQDLVRRLLARDPRDEQAGRAPSI